jgi:cytochrome b subunit of formate dehydrogenase
MFFSGLVIWDQYFYQYTVIETKRWALLASGAATCGGGGRPSRP